MPETYWICPNCETRNPHSAHECEVCGEARPVEKPKPPVEAPMPRVLQCTRQLRLRSGETGYIKWIADDVDFVVCEGETHLAYGHHAVRAEYTRVAKERTIRLTFHGKGGTVTREVNVFILPEEPVRPRPETLGPSVRPAAPTVEHKPKRKFGDAAVMVLVGIVIAVACVAGIAGAIWAGTTALRSHQAKETVRNEFRMEMAQASIDTIDALDSAYVRINELEAIGGDIATERAQLRNKAQSIYDELDRKYTAAPGGTKVKNTLNKKREHVSTLLEKL